MGIEYRTGCFLKLADLDDQQLYPQFAVLKDILVVEDIKLLVVQLVRVDEFLHHYFAYRISHLHNGDQQVIVITDLSHKFPVYATKLHHQIFLQMRNTYCIELHI